MVAASLQAIVSAAIWGAAAGAVGGGRLADLLGRKKALSLADALFIAGSLCMALAPGWRSWPAVGTVIVGRVLVGVGVGIASVVVPVYLAETARAVDRASAVAASVLMITVGASARSCGA